MIWCYPQPNKQRSHDVLTAFAQGCTGRIVAHVERLEPGPAAFYGTLGLAELVREAMATRTCYYGDNAYFDRARGQYFRFASNAFQVSKLCRPDHARLKALGVEIKPWRRDGRHIILVEQSGHFLELCGAGADWLERTTAHLKWLTDRPLRIRRWRRDKGKAAATLAADLHDAHALVTHMSAAANETLIAGVPVFVTGDCAAKPMASGPLSDIERPLYPDGREEWAAGLAAMQWTLDEFRSGMAWQSLNQ